MNETLIGGRQYIHDHPVAAIPYLVIATTAAIIGTIGNLLVLYSIFYYVPLRKPDSVFLINLALADLLVASFGDPFGIVGMYLYIMLFLESDLGPVKVVAEGHPLTGHSYLGTLEYPSRTTLKGFGPCRVVYPPPMSSVRYN